MLKEKAIALLPAGLVVQKQAFPTIFVDTGRINLRAEGSQGRVNEAIYRALQRVHSRPISGQTLLKVHIGEPKCATRMKPEYTISSVRFIRERGASGVVHGDTTVAYSGSRGHKQNPTGNASRYLKLARQHGWASDGPVGIPFVVLDRPCTAMPGQFEFSVEEERGEVHSIKRFKDFFLAGGFGAADFVINHAHLTLHGLAGLAGCVKSIAMGCSSLKGKLRMHQSLLPHFDSELCVGCGQCVDSCPEDALKLPEGNSYPVIDSELCIGCGECQAVCPKKAVTLQCEDITDWERGEDTLSFRMADYTMGLMNGRWENTVHMLHMYDITQLCDCLDIRQEPMLKRDIGFLVGKNPFAIDQLAARMLTSALGKENHNADQSFLRKAEASAAYVEKAYGVLRKTPLKKEKL